MRSVRRKLNFAETAAGNGNAVEGIYIIPYVLGVWPGRHLNMSFVKGHCLGCSPGYTSIHCQLAEKLNFTVH